MWKRDEAVRSPAVPNNEAAAAAPAAATQASRPDNSVRGQGRDVVNIGKSVVIKGELNGSEDLTIEGHVEGRIELRENVLTIGPNGKIKAELFAKAIVILGEVIGNVVASEKVDIRENGSVEGDITAPREAAKPAVQAPRPTPQPDVKPMAAQPVVVPGQQGQQGQRLGA